jgi:cytoskeleton protein RodZ
MPSIAEQLRHAREEQHLTVQQVAGRTNIKTDQLRALEEGNYDGFAAPVYIRGFVRTYATLLKLPLSEVMPQLDAELAQTTKFREPPSLSPHPHGPLDVLMFQVARLGWRRTLLVLAVIGGMAAGFWAYHYWAPRATKEDPLSGVAPGLYKPPANTSAEVLPLPGKTGRK